MNSTSPPLAYSSILLENANFTIYFSDFVIFCNLQSSKPALGALLAEIKKGTPYRVIGTIGSGTLPDYFSDKRLLITLMIDTGQ